MNLKNTFYFVKADAKKILFVFAILLAIFISYFGYLNATLYKENTVILKMGGGLGNQLFQYSAAYEFAKKTNSKLYIYLSKRYTSDANNTSYDRYFDLYKFGITEKQIISHSFKNKILFKLVKKLRNGRTFDVNQQNFFNFTASNGPNIYFIQDTFEAIKYFRNSENEIKSLFSAKHLVSERTASLVKKLQEKNSVCVHSRLGDHEVMFGESLNISYYNEAIGIIKDKVVNPKFYVFSDDIIKTKEKFKKFKDFNYISNSKLLPIDDFYLLANCANNINSNSTFSLWASFVNPNLQRIVISPFKNLRLEMHEGYDKAPKNWILINTF